MAWIPALSLKVTANDTTTLGVLLQGDELGWEMSLGGFRQRIQTSLMNVVRFLLDNISGLMEIELEKSPSFFVEGVGEDGIAKWMETHDFTNGQAGLEKTYFMRFEPRAVAEPLKIRLEIEKMAKMLFWYDQKTSSSTNRDWEDLTDEEKKLYLCEVEDLYTEQDKLIESSGSGVRKRQKKQEEEPLEGKTHQRLNLLFSQIEFYSCLMLKNSSVSPDEVFTSASETSSDNALLLTYPESESRGVTENVEPREQAITAALNAVLKQKRMTREFDDECLKLRQESDLDTGSANLDLLHPSTVPVTSTVRTTALFNDSLREDQHKVLEWLVNCYERGLNGILADETGMGKTIQTLAFLAHLAGKKNTWGRFLVVAPASNLGNWADEIKRFCPALRTLHYKVATDERKALMKTYSIRQRESDGFHILITSYNHLLFDHKYFREKYWQYMVLDEAQKIRSSDRENWKKLRLKCRNCLLLTSTPIPNNMDELLILLHSLMPTLFDSLDLEQFDERSSPGTENHAEHGGTFNQHQLDRLDGFLKPFILHLRSDMDSA